MLAMETFAVGPLDCNCTIVADTESGDAIVVDGGDGVDDVVAHLERRGWRARLLVHTHAHIDHIGDLGALRDRTSASGLLHPADLPLYQTLAMQARWIGLPNAPPVVSIDGEKDGVQAIVDGKLGCSCECNPRFGPAGFDILYKYAAGEKIPPMIINPDRFFDASNAKEVLPTAF